jgi:hypothetical protein
MVLGGRQSCHTNSYSRAHRRPAGICIPTQGLELRARLVSTPEAAVTDSVHCDRSVDTHRGCALLALDDGNHTRQGQAIDVGPVAVCSRGNASSRMYDSNNVPSKWAGHQSESFPRPPNRTPSIGVEHAVWVERVPRVPLAAACIPEGKKSTSSQCSPSLLSCGWRTTCNPWGGRVREAFQRNSVHDRLCLFGTCFVGEAVCSCALLLFRG